MNTQTNTTAGFEPAIDDATLQQMCNGAQSEGQRLNMRFTLLTMARDSNTLLKMALEFPETYEDFAGGVLDFYEFAKAQAEVADAALSRLAVIEQMRQAAPPVA